MNIFARILIVLFVRLIAHGERQVISRRRQGASLLKNATAGELRAGGR